MRRWRRADGQAAVELVALLPLLALLAAGAWQLAVAGHAAWAADAAARAAARAEAVGRDPAAAARGSLPGRLEQELIVERAGGGVRVVVAIPRVLGLPALGSVAATAQFREQR